MIDIKTPKFSGVMTQIWEPRHREIDQAKRLPERCLNKKPRIDAVTLFDVKWGCCMHPHIHFFVGA